MGLSWGLGHGTTLVLLGLPLVLLGQYLPEEIQKSAEVAMGIIIVALGGPTAREVAPRRLPRPPHTHESGDTHRHLHSHAEDSVHEHAHDTALRTPLSAYGVGLVHGVGGSGGLTLLLLSTPSLGGGRGATIFAAGTAVSMALLSTVFGHAIASGPVARNFERIAPVLGVLAAAFGVWYALGALGILAYPFG